MTQCDHEGCENGIATGHALYRISLKGEAFVGLCAVHYVGPLDPIAVAIEDHNHRRRKEAA